MLLSKPVQWHIAILLLVPLTIIIFKILDYFIFNSFGITSILVLCCFTPIFFIRRNYSFNYNLIFQLYIITILGAFLIAYFKEQSIFFFIVLLSWISLSKNSSLTKNGKFIKEKIEKEDEDKEGFMRFFSSPTRISENRKYLLDLIILISTALVFIFIFNFIRNLF